MNILTVIPARGGSKGIKHKNIYQLNGRPLISYTIDALRDCTIPMDIVVSTDDEAIAEVARGMNIEVIDRPAELATDRASTEDALIHALDYMNKKGNNYAAVITAQPTSPFRTSKTIEDFINAYIAIMGEYDAMLTLHADYTDYWIRDDSGNYGRRCPEAPRRRQDREPLYAENSCLYITDVNALRSTKSVLGTRCNGYMIKECEALDINTMEDMELAQLRMQDLLR